MQSISLNKREGKMERKKNTIIQFIKFGLVGVCNTIVSYVIYSICYYMFHMNVHASNAMGFLISILVAYLLQNRFVFKESEHGEERVWWKVLLKTYVSYIFSGLILTEILMLLWFNIIHIERYLYGLVNIFSQWGFNVQAKNLAASLAPIINMFFTVPINFCANKFWAYRDRK